MIYLDSNSTTKISLSAWRSMSEGYAKYWTNPSSSHNEGEKAKRMLNKTKEIFLSYFPNKEHVIYTGSGTEADNMATNGLIKGFFSKYKRLPSIACSSIEHAAILNSLKESPYKIKYSLIQCNKNCEVEIESYMKTNKEPDILFLMAVNNVTGVIQPLELARNLAPHSIIVSDFIQCCGKLRKEEIQNLASYVDILTLSSHKFHGPKGVGCVLCSEKAFHIIAPIEYGGHQENGRRPGTENLPGIMGMTTAFKAAIEMPDRLLMEIMSRRILFERAATNLDCTILGASAPRVSNTTSLLLPKSIDIEKFRGEMRKHNICVSVGSACNAVSGGDHVYNALGLSKEAQKRCIRVSTSGENTLDDYKILISILKKIDLYMN